MNCGVGLRYSAIMVVITTKAGLTLYISPLIGNA
jgi:hypothetical protein